MFTMFLVAVKIWLYENGLIDSSPYTLDDYEKIYGDFKITKGRRLLWSLVFCKSVYAYQAYDSYIILSEFPISNYDDVYFDIIHRNKKFTYVYMTSN